MRAIAAFAIIAHHAGFASGDTFTESYGNVLGRLDLGVPVFFVLSGFLLYRPFVAAHLDDTEVPPTVAFLRRRVLRIYPAYWLAFLVLVAVGSVQVNSIWSFLACFTLLHVAHQRTALDGLTQSWSLSVEMAFYAFLPLYAWATTRALTRVRATLGLRALCLLAGAGLLAAASLAFRLLMWIADPPWWELQYVWFPTLADMFAAGMALAVLDMWACRSPLAARLARSIADKAAWAWVGAAFVIWFVSNQLGLPIGLARGSHALEAARQTCYLAVGVLAVAPVALGTHRARPTAVVRFLRLRPLAFLGAISYGIYLWHQAGIEATQWALGLEEFEGHWYTLTLGAAVFSVPVAWASYRFLEVPVGRRFGRRTTPRRSATTT